MSEFTNQDRWQLEKLEAEQRWFMLVAAFGKTKELREDAERKIKEYHKTIHRLVVGDPKDLPDISDQELLAALMEDVGPDCENAGLVTKVA